MDKISKFGSMDFSKFGSILMLFSSGVTLLDIAINGDRVFERTMRNFYGAAGMSFILLAIGGVQK